MSIILRRFPSLAPALDTYRTTPPESEARVEDMAMWAEQPDEAAAPMTIDPGRSHNDLRTFIAWSTLVDIWPDRDGVRKVIEGIRTRLQALLPSGPESYALIQR